MQEMISVTAEQKEVMRGLFAWLKNPTGTHLTFGGFAGTGKTTTIAAFRQILHQMKPEARVAFCAYTGKASRVLAVNLRWQKATFPQDSVSTIHSLIYAPMTEGGRVTGWRRKNDIKADLIVIDEASMVDELVFQDLIHFKLPIIAVGDHGQLPPVNGSFNLMAKPRLRLETIHRQAQDNPIIKVSIYARETGKIPIQQFGRGVQKLNRYEATTGQEVEDTLRQYSPDLMILTGYNQTRLKLNQTIREYLDFEGEVPRVGETLICLKNNWEKGIYNGMTGTLKRILPIQDNGVTHWYEVEVDIEGETLYEGKISAHQFGQPSTLTAYEGLSYRALGDLWDFGYSLTVHKAQGSQAEEVLLFEERNKHMSDEDWRRWLYTGVTRAEERLTIVGV